MANWVNGLLNSIEAVLTDDDEWQDRFNSALSGAHQIHLAIFDEPYLEYVLQGKKTVESRFSVHRIGPYREVEPGDILLIKRVSGPVVGICDVSEVEFFRLNCKVLGEIRKEYEIPLCASNDEFWDSRRHKRFATLMTLSQVKELPEMACEKQDRRGWVSLVQKSPQLSLEIF